MDELESAVGRVQKRVELARMKLSQDTQIRKQREVYLVQLAEEFAKSHNIDDKAIEVFEQLVENPQCEPRWIQNLAMIYIVRQMWGKLGILAKMVERRIK